MGACGIVFFSYILHNDNYVTVKFTEIGFLMTREETLFEEDERTNALGLKKKLFVSCNPTLTSFYSKKIPTLKFFLPSQLPINVKHA